LQVQAALAGCFAADDVKALDVPGLCPLCGTARGTRALAVQGLRYLHCSLCATEWHMVRVQCRGGASGKDIGYHI
jgi:FdhE protein